MENISPFGTKYKTYLTIDEIKDIIFVSMLSFFF